EVQSAFIKDRFILDGVLVINEVVEFIKKSGKRCLIFKVDFEKAYDCVNWEFLEDIMQQMGFGRKWCVWIRACLGSATSSVLVNRSPTKEFALERGIRQGDPLSPFLFLIVAESLNVAMQEVIQGGLFDGVKVGEVGNKGFWREDEWVWNWEWRFDLKGRVVTDMHNLSNLVQDIQLKKIPRISASGGSMMVVVLRLRGFVAWSTLRFLKLQGLYLRPLVEDVLNLAQANIFTGIKREIWKGIVWSVLYFIWTFRNQVVFKGNESKILDLFKEGRSSGLLLG
nr:cysteine-rich receptor-like protein kinase [Tanacetum cinerariifolium]